MFKIFNDNKKHTLERLYNLLGDNVEYDEEKNVVFLPYYYSKKSNFLISKVVKELELDRYILTNEIYYKILEKVIDEMMILQHITLTEELEECSQYLRECINRLNNPKIENNKEIISSIINDIVNELEWASNEEDVVVKSLELRIKCKSQNSYFKIDKYGEVDMDYVDMKSKALKLVTDCLY